MRPRASPPPLLLHHLHPDRHRRRFMNKYVWSGLLIACIAAPAFADGDNKPERQCQLAYEKEQARIRDAEVRAAQEACASDDPAGAVDEASDEIVQRATDKVAHIHDVFVKSMEKLFDGCDGDIVATVTAEINAVYD